MKKRCLFWFIVVSVFFLSACGGGGGGGSKPPTPLAPEPPPSLTAEQIAQFEAASQQISNVLMEADDPFSPEALEAAKQAASAQSAVELAVVDEDDLIIKYRNGGFEVWAGDIPRMIPPADIALPRGMTRSVLARSVMAPVGTRNAVLIFAQYDDPVYELYGDEPSPKDAFAWIEQILIAKGFSVNPLYGGDANIANLKQLSEDSVILQLGHGGSWGVNINPFGSIYAVQTGQKWTDWDETLSFYSADWLTSRVMRVWVPWGKGDGDDEWEEEDEKIREKNPEPFLAVTDRFWAHYYQNKHFKNGLFFNLACKGSRYEDYRNALFGVGIQGYTGWPVDVGVSPYTAWWMLAEMAAGKTLQQAYDALPCSLNHDLWIGKGEGLNLTLDGPIIQEPEITITITSPENGVTIITRTCIVEGKITPWQSDESYATISVNGMSNALPVDNAGNFSHEVELRAGDNTIRISVVTMAVSSKEIQVTGVFEPDIFWSQLSWNTDLNDIDLHLVPVEGADGKLDEECYFSHKWASWGAELDVDDVDGYGPEHITARNLPAGKYLLYVHYFATHGQIMPAVVTVKVSVNGGQTQVYTLPAMKTAGYDWRGGAGDFWEVCYVSYPAGTIETIDEYIPAQS